MPQAKAMLVPMCVTVNGMPEKYLVAASGMAGYGAVPMPSGPRRVTERFYLCGDGASDVADEHRPCGFPGDAVRSPPGPRGPAHTGRKVMLLPQFYSNSNKSKLIPDSSSQWESAL